jgi:molecular chaperone GrpE
MSKTPPHDQPDKRFDGGEEIPVHYGLDDNPGPDAPDRPGPPEPAEAPGGELESLRRERDDLMGRLQRLAADYQNYQKRSAKEQQQARQFANEGLMKELLGVLDDMERALEAARENHPPEDPLLVGTEMVHGKFLAALKHCGLEPIDAEGQPFDPQRHSAMMQEPTDQAEPMTVLRVLQRGYELKGRTLRPAAVVVAQAPSDEATET